MGDFTENADVVFTLFSIMNMQTQCYLIVYMLCNYIYIYTLIEKHEHAVDAH